MPVLTAFENVELPLLLTGLPRRERRERVETALALVGLADRMDHYPSELSGGQQQRVAIARAVITDPTILVADEPTGDLDRAVAPRRSCACWTGSTRELGKTIIMVTHDRARGGASAHAIMHLEKGELSEPRTSTSARSSSRGTSGGARVHLLKLILRNALRHKLRTGAHGARPRGRDPRLRPAADGGRRLVRGRGRPRRPRGWSRATRSR